MGTFAALIGSGLTDMPIKVRSFRRVVEKLKHTSLKHEISEGDAWGSVSREDRSYRNGESWVMWIGSPFPIDRSGMPVEAIIRMFPQNPVSVLKQLDGQFVLMGFDGKNGVFYLAGDAAGSLGAYYAVESGCLYVSTSAIAIARSLEAAPRPDFFAIDSFLFSGGYVGNSTLFEQVKRVEGGVLYAFSRGEMRTSRWYSFDESVPEQSTEPLDRSVDRISELFVDAIRKSLPKTEPIWCQLTAGYDTRVLASALANSGAPFLCTVYGPEEHTDVQGARQVCSALGWDLQVCGLPETWGTLQAEFVEKAIGLTDGHYDVLGFARHLFWDNSLLSKSHYLYSAIAGELLRDFFWRQESVRAGRSNRVNLPLLVDARYLNVSASQVRQGGLEQFRTFRELLIDFLDQRLSPLRSRLNTFQLDILYLDKVTRFGCEYISSSLPYFSITAPFLFRRLLETCFALPPTYRQRTRLIRHLVFRLSPELAALPTNYGHPLTPVSLRNSYRFMPWVLDDARRILRKIIYLGLGMRIFEESTTKGYVEKQWIATLMSNKRFRTILQANKMVSAKLYEPAHLHEFLRNAEASRVADPGLFGRMLTLELAFREAKMEIS